MRRRGRRANGCDTAQTICVSMCGVMTLACASVTVATVVSTVMLMGIFGLLREGRAKLYSVNYCHPKPQRDDHTHRYSCRPWNTLVGTDMRMSNVVAVGRSY